ncbi:MAG: SNF2-related protein [Limisphaerales bacterium]
MRKRKGKKTLSAPSAHDWRTTDQDEVTRRQIRAKEGRFRIVNTDPRHPIHSTFHVHSGEDRRYSVEFRDAARRDAVCSCVDFRVNGLGTCKHFEAVLLHLERRERVALRSAKERGSDRYEVLPDPERQTLRLVWPRESGRGVPASLRRWFDAEGYLVASLAPDEAVRRLRGSVAEALPGLRVSQEVDAWLEMRRRAAERIELRRLYELKVQSGEWPMQETRVPLFPYQREGMLHLAFSERALLADEMGLGKTIQAIAACALLQRLGQARRVLVVTPASLKAEWEEQIRRFTSLDCELVFGGRHRRLEFLRRFVRRDRGAGGDESESPAPFFVVMNYEQVIPDVVEINDLLRPDVVILDEAQRIKNWNTKTALTIKRVRSRYAFVLTGTPIENRIDELRSLVDFLDPAILGPLFRFNRDFYEFDDRGRPVAFRNLPKLHERVRPVLLRRRKAEVETELPPRTERQLFVPMSEAQRKAYGGYEQEVMKLVQAAQRRPLTEKEQESLQIQLGMMRMTCDTTFILDREDRTCPKLDEIARILEECRDNGTQVIVFSEWERMLMLVRDWCVENDIRHAWHTGSVPQKARRAEINTFKSDPNCLVFLSTDAGATGLNLQNASVVVNCDLPWNPAKLEQRIARAWRKNQVRSVTVINLISENTIEHRMLGTLATKRAVAESVLDKPGSVERIPIGSGRKAMIERLQGLIGTTQSPDSTRGSGSGAERSALERRELRERFELDPSLTFARFAAERVGPSLLACTERRQAKGGGPVACFVVEQDAAGSRARIDALRDDLRARVGGNPADLADRIPAIEVIDRQTHETIERLIAAGLLLRPKSMERILPLSGEPARPLLNPEEIERCRAGHARSEHALRRARVLGEAGFESECGASLAEAALHLAGVLALVQRLPPPESLDATFSGAYEALWGESATVLEELTGDSLRDWRPIAATLADVAEDASAGWDSGSAAR